MDGLAIHPYAPGAAPGGAHGRYHSFALAVEQLGQVMAAHGDGATPLWITEMGWSTARWTTSPAPTTPAGGGAGQGLATGGRVLRLRLQPGGRYPDLGLIAPAAAPPPPGWPTPGRPGG